MYLSIEERLITKETVQEIKELLSKKDIRTQKIINLRVERV